MATDLLSDVLEPLRLRGAYYSRWAARAPWGVRGDEQDCAVIHYVRDGECAVVGREQQFRLGAGDLAVFPHGASHVIADRPGRSAVALDTLLPDRHAGASHAVEIGGGGAPTDLLCGGLHYDPAAVSPLYRALPAVLVLDAPTVATEPLLGATLHRIADDAERSGPGARLVALRAFELVFVLALRVALRSAREPLVRALRHPAIARTLQVMHTRFAEPWTLPRLAEEARMSRSVFASTFAALVGTSPMRHLTERRMQEAARLLGDTDLSQHQIAARVGYSSEVGFHLAFRRWCDAPPGEYRRRARAADDPRTLVSRA